MVVGFLLYNFSMDMFGGYLAYAMSFYLAFIKKRDLQWFVNEENSMENYILIKFFSKEEYMQDFLDGNLYMNSLYYFWNQFALDQAAEKRKRDLDINPDLDPDTYVVPITGGPGPGQIDLFEGTAGTEAIVHSDLPSDFKDYAIADIVYRSVGMGYCNVLCFYKLDYQIQTDGLLSYSLGNMKEFGEYAVIIENVDELARRIELETRKKNFQCACGPVFYKSLKLNNGPVKEEHHVALKEDILYDISTQSLKRDAFVKMDRYSYQKEWRVALNRSEKDAKAYRLTVGNLRDIVCATRQDELVNKIDTLFREKRIKWSSSNWYGDDRRQLREQLHQLGDNKAERFILLGGNKKN